MYGWVRGGVAFSPDSKILATGFGACGNSGSGVMLWDVDLGSWLCRAEEIANRNFIWAEWQQYFPGRPYSPTFPNLPVPAEGYDLRLMSSVDDVGGIPTAGKRLIIVAAVKSVLHFRIFDCDGQMVVDTDETKLMTQAGPIEDLRKQLESLWPPHELTESEKARVIAAVTSIHGDTPPKVR